MKISEFNRNLLKETLIYSVGNFGSKILSFLLIPFYTFFLEKDDLGEYDILITTVSLIVPLVSLQVSDSTYRWLVTDNSRGFRASIISNSFLILFFSFGLFVLISLVLNLIFKIKYFLLFACLTVLSSILPFFLSILRGMGETKKFALNGIITTALTVSMTFAFVYYFKMKIEGILLANIISYFISTIIIAKQVKLLELFDIKLFNLTLVKEFLQYSLPLIPNLLSWWIIASASKYIILEYMGLEANGLYAVASRFPSILIVINSVLLLPLQDSVLKEEGNKIFEQFFFKFSLLELFLSTILGVFSPLLTKVLVDGSYFQAWRYMPLLFMGVCFNAISSFLGLYHQKNKKTVYITISSFIGALASVGTAFFLIERLGLKGISISFLVGFLFMFLIRFFVVFKLSMKREIIVLLSLTIFNVILFELLSKCTILN